MLTATESMRQVGPYHVLETIDRSDAGEWLLGYDPRLLRRVWIHNLPSGSPPLEARVRGIGRIGRLRWLAGRRSSTENWDSYEAVQGKPLASALGHGQPWGSVGYWLLDLAEELAIAGKDGTVPRWLSADRVWITSEGRAKLLDVPVPGADPLPDNAGQAQPKGHDIRITRSFINQVAIAGLEGRSVTADEASSIVAKGPVPIRAREFLESLPKIVDLDLAVTSAREAARPPHAASPWRRAVILVICCLPGLAAAITGISALMKIDQVPPDIRPLVMHLIALDSLKYHHPCVLGELPLKGTEEEVSALERYIAYRFGSTIRDKQQMDSGYADMVPSLLLMSGEWALRDHPEVGGDEFREVEVKIAPLERMLSGPVNLRPVEAVFLLYSVSDASFSWLLMIASLGLAAALIARRGMLLWVLGLKVVRADGPPATRLRVFWRSLIVWSPLAVWMVLWSLLFWPAIQSFSGGALLAAAGILIWSTYLGLAIWSALLPGRGIADRLAGTWLVPQ
jgi:hypothetical protein